MNKLRKVYKFLCRYSENVIPIKPWIETVGVVVLILYTIFAGYQASQMRRANKIAVNTFNAIDRPFIGVVGINTKYLARNALGVEKEAEPNAAELMQILASIKNYGPVPGTNFVPTWKLFVNGIRVLGTAKIPDSPGTIFPNQTVGFGGTVGRKDYPEVLSGAKILVLEITVEYDGPSSHYKECNRQQYSNWVHGFIDLGAACGS
jgi:hypothetical protein